MSIFSIFFIIRSGRLLETTAVRNLFDSIAPRYDLLNHLLSGGIDRYWRQRALRRLNCEPRETILDVATGTADFAIAAARLQPSAIVGIDIADKMLQIGREKIAKRGLQSLIRLENGKAEHLRFETDSFDAAIVAFGVRNFENLDKGLREVHRVLRPGGNIVVLEFSHPRVFPFRQCYFVYFHRIVPFIGGLMSGNPAAYNHLRDSVLQFPEGDEFLDILRHCGFVNTREDRMTFGIASAYTGTKPE
jgi:demethylmenaquinone methyltransferase/2-methoxy-6-polyprenyl-1,4-benzoquinol methylase